MDGDNQIVFMLHSKTQKLVLMVNMETTVGGNATSTVVFHTGVTE